MLLHFTFIGKANLKLVMIGYFLNANCFHFLSISFQFLQLLKGIARICLFMRFAHTIKEFLKSRLP